MSDMLRASLSLAWKMAFGALILVAGLGGVGALFSGEWLTGLALLAVAIVLTWVLARSLRGQRVGRP
ncbi:MAG: hypothetical protein JW892_01895 [Anaerolineae bacterium]|nr:hypothetical protein [Anaerolineae bacterium]